MSHSPVRREFIIRLASVSAVLAAGASLSGCGDSDTTARRSTSTTAWRAATRSPTASSSGPTPASGTRSCRSSSRYELAEEASFAAIASREPWSPASPPASPPRSTPRACRRGRPTSTASRRGTAVSPVGQHPHAARVHGDRGEVRSDELPQLPGRLLQCLRRGGEERRAVRASIWATTSTNTRPRGYASENAVSTGPRLGARP